MVEQLELKEAQDKPRQSWGEVIQFLDGLCFGIAPNGQTVCLGKEADIKEMLTNPAKRSINPLVNGIIDLERELTKEDENNGDTKHRARKASLERSRFTRPIGAKSAATRYPKIKQRFPYRISKSKK